LVKPLRPLAYRRRRRGTLAVGGAPMAANGGGSGDYYPLPHA